MPLPLWYLQTSLRENKGKSAGSYFTKVIFDKQIAKYAEYNVIIKQINAWLSHERNSQDLCDKCARNTSLSKSNRSDVKQRYQFENR